MDLVILCIPLSVAIQWVALILPISKVPGLELFKDADRAGLCSSGLSLFPRSKNSSTVPQIIPLPFPSISKPSFINRLIIPPYKILSHIDPLLDNDSEITRKRPSLHIHIVTCISDLVSSPIWDS
jgi:hypothetical protein